jgi:lipopolysaccharide/colanic/teichoic acid biosynthesis glycosyltransferase
MNQVLAAFLLLLVSPLLTVILLLVWLTDRRPPLYLAERTGLGGSSFRMAKIRTMRPGSDAAGAITGIGDRRVTPFGRFLRNTKLDEVPQLFNIVRGDMAFFGPRPEDPGIVERCYDDTMRKSLAFLPGLFSPGTLWALKNLRRIDGAADPEEAYVREILPERLAIDTDYFGRATFGTNLRLMAETVVQVLKRAVSAKDRE